jgi:threonine synthase
MDENVPMIVLETALPIKFEDSIVEAIGQKPDRPESLRDLESLPQMFEILDNQVEAVKNFIRQSV